MAISTVVSIAVLINSNEITIANNNKHIIHSYDEFYALANHYKVKCQGFLLFEKKLGNILKYHKNIKKCKQEK